MGSASPQVMLNLIGLSVLVLALMFAAAEAADDSTYPKPKRAKKPDPNTARCTDPRPRFDFCRKYELPCPKKCPRNCTVDCRKCQPVCASATAAPSSPPPPYYHHNYPPPPSTYAPSSPPPSSTPPSQSYPPPPTSTTPTTPSSPPTSSPASPAPSSSTPSSPPPSSSTPSPSVPPVYSPPPPVVSGRKRVRCHNRNYSECFGQFHYCPDNCPTTCQVDCNTCKPVCSCDYPGAVCQDPRFIGGDGITFYFHGKKNEDFCIVSDNHLHINAHFIGKRNANLTRDFTWVQSLGIMFGKHKLFLGARKTATWDDSVDHLSLALDGEPIFLYESEGSTYTSGSTTITRTADTNTVTVEVRRNFKITAKVVPITDEESRVHNYGITNQDCFAHLDLGFQFYSLGSGVDGVLGKTYRDDCVSKVRVGAAMPVVGGEADYQTSSLFAPDCSVARFRGESMIKEFDGNHDHGSVSFDLSSLKCASGLDGAGVVCKR